MTATGLPALFARGSASRRAETTLQALAGALVFLFPFSLLFIAGGLLPAYLGWIGSVVIFLYGALVLVSELRVVPPGKAAARFAVLAGGLLLLEWAGVTTGVPFGRYVYEETLGFRVAGVPAAIAVAWYATLVTGWRISRRLLGPAGGPAGHAAVTALLTLAMDLLLEPFASQIVSYWTWVGGSVPLQNYAAWCVIAAAAAAVLSAAEGPPRAAERNLLPANVLAFGLQVLLFAVTNVSRGFWLEAVAAGALIAGIAAATRSLRLRGATAGESAP